MKIMMGKELEFLLAKYVKLDPSGMTLTFNQCSGII
jgi:hypothetical protein